MAGIWSAVARGPGLVGPVSDIRFAIDLCIGDIDSNLVGGGPWAGLVCPWARICGPVGPARIWLLVARGPAIWARIILQISYSKYYIRYVRLESSYSKFNIRNSIKSSALIHILNLIFIIVRVLYIASNRVCRRRGSNLVGGGP